MSWKTLREKAAKLRQEWLEDTDSASDAEEDFDIWEGGDALPGTAPRVIRMNFTDPYDEPYELSDPEIRELVAAARRRDRDGFAG